MVANATQWTRPASFEWFHPALRGALRFASDAAERVDAEGPHASFRYPEWRRFKEDHVRLWAPGVYSVPYLSEGMCKALVEHMRNLGYEPNEDEEPQARINECVLNYRDPMLFNELNALWLTAMPTLAKLLLQLDVQSCRAIQGAVYTPDGTSETGWHLDEDSECTAVVALNHGFEGGGTTVWRDDEEYDVPVLPVGHIMLFNGRSTLHKGNHVSAGERHLLVHWCMQQH